MVSIEIKAHPKQDDFIRDESLYVCAIAGRGAGKSMGGAIKSLLKCIENPSILGVITAPTYKVLNDATIPTYQEVFSKVPEFAKFIGGDSPEARCINDSKLIFRSTEKAENLRGLNSGFVHMDEARGSPRVAYTNLLAGMRQVDKQGVAYPYQLWITTTPKGMGWLYTEFFLEDKPDHGAHVWTLLDNKYADAGFIERMKTTYSGAMYEQEIEGKFVVLEGLCVFNVKNLTDKLARDCKEPLNTYDGIVSVWKHPVFGVRYVAGGDCADRGGGGANCMVIIDWQTGEECAEIYGDIPSDVFARYAFDWGKKYNDCLLGIEANSVGSGVIARLEDAGYPRLYRSKNGKLGLYTHAGNRETMLDEYRVAVDNNQTVIRNIYAIEEMQTFIRKEKKWEHIEEARDDRVMARAIAWQMKKENQSASSAKFKSYIRRETTYA